MRVFFQSWKAEYKNILRDKGAALMMIAAFLAYPFLVPTPYLPEVLKDVPVAVVDLDSSQMSRQLIRMLDASELLMTVSYSRNFTEEKTNFYRGENHGIIVIPREFQRKIMRGEKAAISVYSDASYFLIYKQIITGCLQASGTLSATIGINHLLAKGYELDKAVHTVNPLRLTINDLFNPAGGYAEYIVPAVFIILLQQTLLIGIGILAGTRHDEYNAIHSSAENLETPSRIMGKSVAYLSIYMVHAIYLVSLLHLFYRFPQRGSLSDLFIFMFIFLFAVTFMGIALSRFFKRRETSIMILLFTSIIALFLSGIAWPVESLPHWLRIISLIIPTTTGIDGFLRINQMGATLSDVWFDGAMLCLLSIAYFLLAYVPIALKSSRQTSVDELHTKKSD